MKKLFAHDSCDNSKLQLIYKNYFNVILNVIHDLNWNSFPYFHDQVPLILNFIYNLCTSVYLWPGPFNVD